MKYKKENHPFGWFSRLAEKEGFELLKGIDFYRFC